MNRAIFKHYNKVWARKWLHSGKVTDEAAKMESVVWSNGCFNPKRPL